MEDEFKLGHEFCRCLETALDTECEHATESMLEVLAAEFMVRIALQTRIVHAFDCRMFLKEFCNCKSVVTAAFCPERERLQSLKHQE